MKTRHKMFIARAAYRAVSLARRLCGRGPIAVARRGGFRWELDLREAIDLVLYLRGGIEPATRRASRAFLSPGGVALDVGANIGGHTLPLARLVGPQGRVLAFEPTAGAFARLRANVGLNPELAPRIEIRQALVLDRAGDGPLPEVYSSWPLAGGAAELHPLHGGRLRSCEGAIATTLDQALAAAGLSRVDFAKIDVDGYECFVLRGARRLLAELRPVILIELAPYCHTEKGHDFSACLEPLLSAGYVLVDEASLGPLPADPREIEAMIAPGSSRNAIALPPGHPARPGAR